MMYLQSDRAIIDKYIKNGTYDIINSELSSRDAAIKIENELGIRISYATILKVRHIIKKLEDATSDLGDMICKNLFREYTKKEIYNICRYVKNNPCRKIGLSYITIFNYEGELAIEDQCDIVHTRTIKDTFDYIYNYFYKHEPDLLKLSFKKRLLMEMQSLSIPNTGSNRLYISHKNRCILIFKRSKIKEFKITTFDQRMNFKDAYDAYGYALEIINSLGIRNMSKLKIST